MRSKPFRGITGQKLNRLDRGWLKQYVLMSCDLGELPYIVTYDSLARRFNPKLVSPGEVAAQDQLLYELAGYKLLSWGPLDVAWKLYAY